MPSVVDVPVKSNKYEYLTFIIDVRHAMKRDLYAMVIRYEGYYNNDWFLLPLLDYCIVFYLDIVSLNV